MTGQPDVEQVLRSWLAEGGERAPDRSVKAALARIEAASQRRPGRVGSRLSTIWAAAADTPFAVATAIVAAVVIGLTLYFGSSWVGERQTSPSPVPERASPSPSPTDSPAPGAAPSAELVPYLNETAGYSILIPAGWIAAAENDGYRVSFTGTYRLEDGGAVELETMTIAVGDADGRITLCVVECRTFSNVDSADELDAHLTDPRLLGPPRDSNYGPIDRTYWPETHAETSLGGERAEIERPVPGCCNDLPGVATQIYLVRDGQAVAISIPTSVAHRQLVTDELMDQVLASFTFMP